MDIPFFTVCFKCHIRGKAFAISGGSNRLTGMIFTAYYNHKPVFNLVADKGKEAASPRKFKHEWFAGNLRWDSAPYRQLNV